MEISCSAIFFSSFFFFRMWKESDWEKRYGKGEEIRTFCPFFSFTHEYLTSTKLEERNTIPFLIENNNPGLAV